MTSGHTAGQGLPQIRLEGRKAKGQSKICPNKKTVQWDSWRSFRPLKGMLIIRNWGIYSTLLLGPQRTWSALTGQAPDWLGKWASLWKAPPECTWFKTKTGWMHDSLYRTICPRFKNHEYQPVKHHTQSTKCRCLSYPQLHTSMAGVYLSSPSKSSGGLYHRVITLLVYGRLQDRDRKMHKYQ